MSRTQSTMVALGSTAPAFELVDVVSGKAVGRDDVFAGADAAGRHGKFLGRPAGTPEQVRRYMEQGFRLFQMPTEIGLMELGARQLLEPLGDYGTAAE